MNEKKKISKKFNNQYSTRNIQYSMKKIGIKKGSAKIGKQKNKFKDITKFK